jgi:CBS domain-containing protein
MTIKSAVVRDYMTENLVTFTTDIDVLDAIHELVRHRIAGAPVLDDHGNLVGMLTELDCMKIALTA